MHFIDCTHTTCLRERCWMKGGENSYVSWPPIHSNDQYVILHQMHLQIDTWNQDMEASHCCHNFYLQSSPPFWSLVYSLKGSWLTFVSYIYNSAVPCSIPGPENCSSHDNRKCHRTGCPLTPKWQCVLRLACISIVLSSSVSVHMQWIFSMDS